MEKSKGAIVQKPSIDTHISTAPFLVPDNMISGGKSYPIPELQNIVSTVTFACKLNLRQIAQSAKNAEYNPRRFAAVIMRIKEPRTTSLIFSSGKMVCTGAKTEDDSKKAAKKFAKIIKKLGYPELRFQDFMIQNIVGSVDICFKLLIEKLLEGSHASFCHYEPEIFPGLIYRMSNPKIVMLIFMSGKIVITGAKKREEILEGFYNMYPVLLSCKCADTYK